MLVAAARRAEGHGIPLVVAADHRVVLRPLRITGANEELGIEPSVDLAVAALQVGGASSVA